MAAMSPATIAATAFVLTLLLAAAPNGADVLQDYVLFSDPPESLLAGQSLIYDMTPHLPYGPHVLSLGRDCNLALYQLGNLSWSTNTTMKDGQGCYLTLLNDGELVLRNGIHYPIWSSGVRSTPGMYALYLNIFGQLIIIGPEIWTNTDTVTMSEPDPAPATTDFIFYNGQFTMATYGTLVTYKNFRLVLQQDCNLVLENTESGVVMWETGTNSTSGDCFATLDDYGELFVKHNRREVLWRSGRRSDIGGSVMVLRYDGRLVIYNSQIWLQPETEEPPYLNVLRNIANEN